MPYSRTHPSATCPHATAASVAMINRPRSAIMLVEQYSTNSACLQQQLRKIDRAWLGLASVQCNRGALTLQPHVRARYCCHRNNMGSSKSIGSVPQPVWYLKVLRNMLCQVRIASEREKSSMCFTAPKVGSSGPTSSKVLYGALEYTMLVFKMVASVRGCGRFTWDHVDESNIGIRLEAALKPRLKP